MLTFAHILAATVYIILGIQSDKALRRQKRTRRGQGMLDLGDPLR